jgi:hypothetical protein
MFLRLLAVTLTKIRKPGSDCRHIYSESLLTFALAAVWHGLTRQILPLPSPPVAASAENSCPARVRPGFDLKKSLRINALCLLLSGIIIALVKT